MRTSTSSYIVELPLRVNDQQNRFLEKAFEFGRTLYNATLGTALGRLQRMRETQEWRVARECQDFCVWGGYSRGSPTRLPFVFEMQYARPDAIAGAKVEGPARSAGGSSLAPAIARREAAGALAREV